MAGAPIPPTSPTLDPLTTLSRPNPHPEVDSPLLHHSTAAAAVAAVAVVAATVAATAGIETRGDMPANSPPREQQDGACSEVWGSDCCRFQSMDTFVRD